MNGIEDRVTSLLTWGLPLGALAFCASLVLAWFGAPDRILARLLGGSGSCARGCGACRAAVAQLPHAGKITPAKQAARSIFRAACFFVSSSAVRYSTANWLLYRFA